MKVTLTIQLPKGPPMKIEVDGTPDECVTFITKWMSSFQSEKT